MKSLLITSAALFLTSSAMAEPAKCTATAEVTNGHVIFHVEPKQCAKVLYTVGEELTSITSSRRLRRIGPSSLEL